MQQGGRHLAARSAGSRLSWMTHTSAGPPCFHPGARHHDLLESRLPMLHLAVIHPTYARLILEGRKTIESRLSRVRCIPFHSVAPGERIYFLARRADLVVTAVADGVISLADLTPRAVSRLRRNFNAHIAADTAYWRVKRDARYATLIWLREPERALYAPDDVHGRAPSYRSAWLTRPESQDVYPACLTPRRAIA